MFALTNTATQDVLAYPILLQEMVLAAWLIVIGHRSSAIASEPDHSRIERAATWPARWPRPMPPRRMLRRRLGVTWSVSMVRAFVEPVRSKQAMLVGWPFSALGPEGLPKERLEVRGVHDRVVGAVVVHSPGG
jgi:hypothetical protein